MKAIGIVIIASMTVLSSCDWKRGEMVTNHTLDSLRSELRINQDLVSAMVDIGVLIDSIDANRSVINWHSVEKTEYRSYVARLRDINQYVVHAQARMTALEKTAKKSNDKAYKRAMDKLKEDLRLRENDIAAITESLNLYKSQNEELLKTVDIQKAELQNQLDQIQTSKLDAEEKQIQIRKLVEKSKMDEAESYFVLARSTEETANRTKFAPKKKRMTLKEALELYKLSQLCGYPDAAVKVNDLEKRLGKKAVL